MAQRPVAHNSQETNDLSHPICERANTINSLTSMRFFAAFVVVLWHFFDPPYPKSPLATVISIVFPWTRHGNLMVDFFFVLSGFVLAYVHTNALTQGTFSTADFVVKRFARIYPMHLLTFIAFASFWVFASLLNFDSREPAPSAWDALSNLTLVQAWGVNERGTFNIPSWSVSAEWLAYLFFPLLILAIRRLHLVTSLAATVALLLCAAYVSPLFGRELTHRTFDFGIFRILFEFPFGIVLCFIYKRNRPFNWRAVFLVSVVAAAVSLSTPVPEVVTVLIFGVLILSAACVEREGAMWFLTHPWLIYGGEISYSIYMLHAVFWVPFVSVGLRVLNVPRESASADIVKCATIGLIIVASSVTFERIEKPARHMILAFYRRRYVPSRSRAEALNAEAASEASQS